MDAGSARHRRLPDNTQHLQDTDIHAPDSIRTHNPSKQAAADRAANGIGMLHFYDGNYSPLRRAITACL